MEVNKAKIEKIVGREKKAARDTKGERIGDEEKIKG